jgi:hypothetical protein
MTEGTWPPGCTPLEDLQRQYHVIIGCGPSALMNHLTLLGSGGLNDGVPILHVGQADPWQGYQQVKMGQWTVLLQLPAAIDSDWTIDSRQYSDSSQFAEYLRTQWSKLARESPYFAIEAVVSAVTKSLDGDGYVVAANQVGGGPVKIRANRIDVCCGPGVAQRLERREVSSRALWKEYLGDPGPSGYSRLTTGEAFLQDQLQGKRRIAVVGGGPTAAWCVERSQAADLETWWISRERLLLPFRSSSRNDGLLRETPPNRTNFSAYPASKNVRFAEGFRVAKVEHTRSGSVRLILESTAGNRTCKASTGKVDPPDHWIFDQVVTAFGYSGDERDVGTGANLVGRLILRDCDRVRGDFIRDQGRVVGVQSRQGRIRILGAAALNHRRVVRVWQDHDSDSFDFRASLAGQARVTSGLPIAGATIAAANGYASDAGNINLMYKDGFANASDQFEVPWVEMRSARSDPFTPEELSLLGKTPARFSRRELSRRGETPKG